MKCSGPGKDKKPFNIMGLLVIFCLAFTATHCGISDPEDYLVREPLQFDEDALEPYISEETMSLHYGKHYAGYVTRANELIMKSPFKGKSGAEIIPLAAGKEEHASLFNNVAQAWNHSFFWKCLSPEGGDEPTGQLAEKIDASFGSFDKFKKLFVAAAQNQFGSGWVWLVLDGDALKVISTSNADTPMAHGLFPIFVVDVWEHAYYLDYQNKRVDFVEAFLDDLANWEFAAAQLESVTKTLDEKVPAKETPLEVVDTPEVVEPSEVVDTHEVADTPEVAKAPEVDDSHEIESTH